MCLLKKCNIMSSKIQAKLSRHREKNVKLSDWVLQFFLNFIFFKMQIKLFADDVKLMNSLLRKNERWWI